MPITSVDGWSTTANLNSDVNGNSIAENCSPAGINNAMREMMAQVAATPLAETAATMRTNLGLGNVNNTSDANKPVSTAQQTALDLKANLAGATFTGSVVVNSDLTVGLVTTYGYAQLSPGSGTTTGYFSWSDKNGLRYGYLGYAAAASWMPWIFENGCLGVDITGGGLRVAGSDVLTKGADVTLFTGGVSVVTADDGTQSSGTYTPSYVGGNLKRIINGGAFTLAAPSASGGYTLVIQITNNGSAGAITLSGFSKSYGDSFTTTDGHDFIVYITKINGFISSHTQALQ